MTTLILVRHGESEWNRAGRIQGQVNSPLTDLGIDQAKAIRDHLSGILLNQELEIYTSPLDRAIQTAEIIAQGIDHPSSKIIIEERLKLKGQGCVGFSHHILGHPHHRHQLTTTERSHYAYGFLLVLLF